MCDRKFPYEAELLKLEEGQEEVLIIGGRAFIVSPATEADIERIGKGFFCLD
ncbi:hypothetical protein [Paenibacillus herberti]|uniref:hypothetical protein n=1 Tax=Paenibacillus herberti TaxID=1619309 RepID=UPI001596210B|nr:hypothetical protein [Paenibacillus herberti]